MSTAAIQFCAKCNNKYYHQIVSQGEGKDSLVFYCIVCNHIDENVTNDIKCVLNTQFHGGKQNVDHLINRYTKYDPTLPKITIKCPNETCNTNQGQNPPHVTDAIYIRYDNVNLKFIYLCTICDTKWKTDDGSA